jgi:16S rRNA (adenine1518-N6/adenine1519-N6)-dimethyltransferase
MQHRKRVVFLLIGNNMFTVFGKAKKSLGQNFLKSEGALVSMITAANVQPGDVVLEIGPGRGALTQRLLEAGATVIAIEKDDELIAPLQTMFVDALASGALTLLHTDALTVNLHTIPALSTGYKLVANIPYYITGALIERFLSTDVQPTSATLLVQKEVAERIVTRTNKESILSISVKVYGIPTYIGTVKRGSFVPAPNVDSAILHIADISKKQFTTANILEAHFFRIVKAGFAHKRKHVGSNLSKLISNEQLASCNITKETRAENLTVQDWVCITSKKSFN